MMHRCSIVMVSMTFDNIIYMVGSQPHLTSPIYSSPLKCGPHIAKVSKVCGERRLLMITLLNQNKQQPLIIGRLVNKIVRISFLILIHE